MNNAVIAQTGTPRELYDEPLDEFVADFIGEANLLNGVLTEVHSGVATVNVDNITIELPSRNLRPGDCRLAVRPTRMTLMPDQTSNTIAGKIIKATYAGSHIEYRVETSLGELFIVTDVEIDYAQGDSVGVLFKPNGPVLLPYTAA